MDRRTLMSPESAQASDIFDKFCSANTLKAILSHYHQLCNLLRLQATHFPDFYPRLRSKLCSWRAQGLWSKFEKRASHKSYARGKSCAGCRVLIIGAGPCGLRTAIEAQLLGAKVVLIEKRDRFSRNNVLHIWPFVITDLKALGAKKFYGKFCAGSIDHISIRQLQCILLKVALLLGVEIHEGVGFEGLCDPTENEGWRAVTSPIDHPVSQYHFDCLIGADGRRNTLDGFKRKALRAKLAIAITANFINKKTEAEARVKEISGVSYIFNQKFFQDLNEATGIDLENIVYYKDETHYFVMTAKKHSLLLKGVLLHDYADTAKLLSHENICTEALMIYALEAAIFSTENQLPNLEYAVNHYGQPDVAMFDFTAMYAAENACRVVQRKGHKLMMTLVGDSLLEPFWPTGSGCARGFLSCFDACWMLRSLAAGNKSLLEVIAERESIYRLLAQTTPENLNKEHIGYTIDPHSRYPNLNQRVVMPFQVKNLYDSDEKLEEQIDGSGEELDMTRITKKRRRDTVIAVDSLLSWLRSQVKCYDLEISDVNDAYVSGDILLAILHRFRPDLIEYPPTSEENVSPLEIAACRNQIAFDFLQKEYGVPPVMNGNESVQCNPSDFLIMVTYLSQLYDIFKGEIPQIKYSRVDGSEDLDECAVAQHYIHNQVKYVRPPAVIAKHSAAAKVNRRSRVSTSSREGRGDGEISETSRRHRKRRSDERSRISLEDRENRLEDIERNRAERQRRRVQERILQTERFIKSMRLLQMNDRADENRERETESFEDYTMHLYRQLAPDFEERCKNLERKLFYSVRNEDDEFGREQRTSTGESQTDNEKQNVTGLTKHLEEKLKGSKHVEKKPKDLIRAIGKIEKSDWNVQLIEKKIAENKGHSQGKKDRDDKVPKWSREAFDDKREAMKRKMEGTDKELTTEKAQLFDETLKRIGTKLTDGSALDVGQRGCNKVSQMAEKLSHNLVKSNKELESCVPKPMVSRPVFEFPKKGGETCHFCTERVYVVERMTAEGKFFHRNCFRCEYCNTSLRLGNYSFDREGRYGNRFYCLPHYNTIRLYGWKKFDQEGKLPDSRTLLLPSSQQILSEMDERGATPERVEFENTVDFASEEELLSEMDEDEWTDRNFGASNADNNTSDEASDLSEDDDATPEGMKAAIEPNELCEKVMIIDSKEGLTGSSDSDTEIASVEGSYEDASCDEEEENGEEEDDLEDCDEEEEEEEDAECGGSTTEVETDSEFAEDPPHSVPGKIPTIVVNEPEQFIARMSESILKSQPKPLQGRSRVVEAMVHQPKLPEQEQYEELKYVEPVILKQPADRRALPRVYPILKKWEPLGERDRSQDVLGSKMSNELKQKYLHGAGQAVDVGMKRTVDPAAQSHLTSVLDMISEKQKLLQPASQPSPAMQAFLEGTNKFKNTTVDDVINGIRPSIEDLKISPSTCGFPLWPQIQKREEILNVLDDNQQCKETINMNRLNLEKTMEAKAAIETEEKVDDEKEMSSNNVNINGGTSSADYWTAGNRGSEIPPKSPHLLSETPLSLSQSKTSSQCTVLNAASGDLLDDLNTDLQNSDPADVDDIFSEGDGTGSETGSVEPISDLDDMDEMDGENQQIPHEPPRVEIEDEFGVTLALDVEELKHLSEGPCKVVTSKSNEDEEPSLNSYSGMSWSDSKDSFSGIFLESELSEWHHGIENELHKNKKTPSSKCQERRNGRNDNVRQSSSKLPFDFDMANLEFADVDGMSSPDDIILSERKKQGYCKLMGDEESGSLVEIEVPIQDICGNTSDSDRSSTSTLGSNSKKNPADFSVNMTNKIKLDKSELIETINPPMKVASEIRKKLMPSNLPGEAENYAILDRVVPFSNARDSLDYRKTKGITSPTRSEDLFSTYTVPSTIASVKPLAMSSISVNSSGDNAKDISQSKFKSKLYGTLDEVVDKRTPIPEEAQEQSQNLWTNSPNQEQSSKSLASPNTVRRIDEISRERALQSDLIRSMVMGRIKKNRRGSLGSLSPIAGTSSSSTSASDSVEFPKINTNQMEGSSENKNDSNRSSQNSILSQNTAETDEGLLSSNNAAVVVGEDEVILSSEETSHSSSNSKSGNGPKGSTKHYYEPVFTSSPRFRNRPKFDGALSIYQSVTNPPTPVNPIVSVFTPVTPVTPNSDSFKNENTKSQNRILNTSSPSLYRSMPDLSKFLADGNNYSPGRSNWKLGKVNSFATPDVKSWEVYKYTSTVDREKARQEARERARLKSDEELGLSPKDRYMELKDKLRRKLSCPEGDVFSPNVGKSRTGDSNSEPNSTSTPLAKNHSGWYSKSECTSPPPKPGPDSVTLLIRKNVDFPFKNNPFLASSMQDSSSIEHTPSKSKEVSGISKSFGDESMDSHLRISPKGWTPARKKSPEKARSVGWDVHTEPFPNYFSSSPLTQQQPSSVPSGRADHNWFSGMSDSKHSTPVHRTRANTVSELHLNQLPGNGIHTTGNNNSSCIINTQNTRNGNQSPDEGNLALAQAHLSVGTLATAYNSPHDTNTIKGFKNSNKTKALSTDMLLDGSSLALAPLRGLSVPDVTTTTGDIDSAVSERKIKKSKDRFRRRSLIQAVSDFFTSRAPLLSGANQASITENEKSSTSTTSTTSSSSPAQPGGSKDKFSIFKLTPKLLQKDKRSSTSKSRESIPIPFITSRGQTSDKGNSKLAMVKSPCSSFISYLSQPEMIIQKLSSSPIPFKSSRASMTTQIPRKIHNGDVGGSLGQTPTTSQTKETPKKPNLNNPEARRIREAREIQLQLESIEIEQRRLESRGVTIEKRLRGEESDDENRDEIELMEEWFTLVREKTRLARFERELIVREKELELEHKQEKVEEKLEESLLIDDADKDPGVRSKEIDMWHDLQSLERQRESLLSKFHEDMQKYEFEDAELEAKIASSSLSPRESNV